MMPPPSTRSSSLILLEILFPSIGSTDESGTDCGIVFPSAPCRSVPRPVTAVSLNVFHSPHSGHLPSHFGSSWPHPEHLKMMFFCFFTKISYHIFYFFSLKNKAGRNSMPYSMKGRQKKLCF
jgi:hypothetical protein